MNFTPQTKRFALVPVEPGNEKDTDVLLEQEGRGDVSLRFACDGSIALHLLYTCDRAIIAVLGFPTEPTEPPEEDGGVMEGSK